MLGRWRLLRAVRQDYETALIGLGTTNRLLHRDAEDALVILGILHIA